jgi:hypothetical protein
MINRELIEKRINNFWGYGNLRSKTWFIGMEESFEGTLEDLEKRFNKTRGNPVIDLHDDMSEIKEHMKWFLPNSNIQSTWSKLILILLTLDSDEKIGSEKMKEFQRKEFARSGSNHCSLDLMPLPCFSLKGNDWIYDQFGIDYLENRTEYLKKVMPLRIKLLQALIADHKPRLIIFYSFTYLDKWREISGCDFMEGNNLYFGNKKKTCFYVIPHPVAQRMKADDWLEIARNIKKASGSSR